jgi:hypothetical protein
VSSFQPFPSQAPRGATSTPLPVHPSARIEVGSETMLSARAPGVVDVLAAIQKYKAIDTAGALMILGRLIEDFLRNGNPEETVQVLGVAVRFVRTR